jgi:outer membrane protein W
MKARILLPLALLLAASTEAQAQYSEWYWGATYSTALPLGDQKTFTGGDGGQSFSFRGATIEGRKILNENVSAGLSFGWQVFNRTGVLTSELGNFALTGNQFRYTNAFPMFANMHYYLGQKGGTRPYIGAGVGTIYEERRVDVNLYSFSQDTWHFAVAPEVGLVFPMGWVVRGVLSVRYHYGFKANDFTPQYFTFSLGLASK